MGIAGITMVLLLSGAYYATRVIPRVFARTSTASTAAAASFSATEAYKRFEGGFASQMSTDEALLILGFDPLQPRPSERDLRDRYRKMMITHHSDVEGSQLVAAKINEAKAHLLPK